MLMAALRRPRFRGDSKTLSVGIIIAGVILMVVTTAFFVILPNLIQSTTKLWIGDGIFRAHVETGNNKGSELSEAIDLRDGQALITALPSGGKWSVQIKESDYPVDIVWLDEDKKVVYIVKNITPYKVAPVTYKPKVLSKYVIKLPVGTVDSKAIRINTLAVFQAIMEP
jgi:uncharacterized membrane protein (UPF0127 family)